MKVLIEEGPMTAPKIAERVPVARTTVYNVLKDLLMAGYVTYNDGVWAITEAGREAFWSSINVSKEVAAVESA